MALLLIKMWVLLLHIAAIKCSVVTATKPSDGSATASYFNRMEAKAQHLRRQIFTLEDFKRHKKLFGTTDCWSTNCPQLHQTFGLLFLTSLNIKHFPLNMNPSDKSSSAASARIKSALGSLHQWHVYFFSLPLRNRARLEDSFDLSLTHPLIWAGACNFTFHPSYLLQPQIPI